MGLLGEKGLARPQATQMNTSHLLLNNPHSLRPGLVHTTLHRAPERAGTKPGAIYRPLTRSPCLAA